MNSLISAVRCNKAIYYTECNSIKTTFAKKLLIITYIYRQNIYTYISQNNTVYLLIV